MIVTFQRNILQYCWAHLTTLLRRFATCLVLLAESAYEVKNNSCLFERLFKVKKNGVFLFRISFFVLEIFTFSSGE